MLQLVREIAIEAGCMETVEYDSPLMDAGLDSLDTLRFRSLLSRKLCDTPLPQTITFDYPTIRAIAEMLIGTEHVHEMSPSTAVEQPDPSCTSVAIVGVSCRFPGKCNDLTSFAKMMATETCTVSDIPLSRWNAFAPASGLLNVNRGHFLEVIEKLCCKSYTELMRMRDSLLISSLIMRAGHYSPCFKWSKFFFGRAFRDGSAAAFDSTSRSRSSKLRQV